MSELISVIVPVYKVENFLDRCIQSIVEQTYQNLEIILVDDGSPDSCPKMCDAWAEKDSRIKIIHKENGGLSHARNCGSEIATGKYITFIDSDDYVLPDYIEYLYSLIVGNNADISCCALKEVYSTDKDFSFNHSNITDCVTTVSGREACFKMYEPEYNIYLVVAHCKLYKSSIVKKFPYPLGKLHEDTATTYKMLYESQKVVIGKKSKYCYYQNTNSIMHTKNKKSFNDTVWAFTKRAEFFKDLNERELEMKAWESIISHFIFTLILNKKRFSKEHFIFFKEHNKNGDFSNKIKLKFLLYAISPFLYKKVMDTAGKMQ